MIERVVVELDRIEVYVLSRGWEDAQLGGEGELLIPSQLGLETPSPCTQINCMLPDQTNQAREKWFCGDPGTAAWACHSSPRCTTAAPDIEHCTRRTPRQL